jgi:2-dehydro-3-deoxygluconokinase
LVPSFDVTAFGETMLRLSVPSGTRLADARSLDVQVGGAESNVLAALAGLGRRCRWLSALPDNDLGRAVTHELNAHGIDTSAVRRSGARVGLYFVEFAVAPRSIEVIYDRAGSAVSRLDVDDVDWDALLDTRILHTTGITAALSEGCHRIVLEACRRARERGVTTCFDVNYRSKLWSPETARERLEPIFRHVDVLVCGEGDAATVFGLRGTPDEVLAGLHTLSGAERVVLTRSRLGSATLVDGGLVQVPAREAEIVDRLGAGDAFAAGVLDGVLDGDPVAGMRRGSVLGALALGLDGDMVRTTRAELERLSLGDAGDIAR